MIYGVLQDDHINGSHETQFCNRQPNQSEYCPNNVRVLSYFVRVYEFAYLKIFILVYTDTLFKICTYKSLNEANDSGLYPVLTQCIF